MKRLALFLVPVLLSLSAFSFVNEDYESPGVNVVNATADSVVKIDVERKVKVSTDPFMDEFFRRFFGERPSPFGGERSQESLGSGFLFDEEGHVLTNEHVVQNADKIKVTLLDGTVYDAEYIGGDSEMDIAILKINGVENNELPHLQFSDSKNLQIGQTAIAIGNPLGFKHTVTTGVVSALERQIPKPDGSGYYRNLIQTDAAINPGNSGGPLLNIHGEVIGINTAIVNPMEGTNLGFAIPINDVKIFIDDLIKFGELKKPQLGVRIMNIDENTKNALGLESTDGALVVEVEPGSPADKAGIKPQDIILEFNGEKVKNIDQLSSMIRRQEIGQYANVKIDRNGEQMNINVELKAAPEKEEETMNQDQEDVVVKDSQKSALLGFSVSNLNTQLRKQYEIPEEVKGVLITEVDQNSYAYRMGLRKGAVLMSINRNQIDGIQKFEEITSSLSSGNSVALYVYVPGQGSLMLSYPLQ